MHLPSIIPKMAHWKDHDFMYNRDEVWKIFHRLIPTPAPRPVRHDILCYEVFEKRANLSVQFLILV